MRLLHAIFPWIPIRSGRRRVAAFVLASMWLWASVAQAALRVEATGRTNGTVARIHVSQTAAGTALPASGYYFFSSPKYQDMILMIPDGVSVTDKVIPLEGYCLQVGLRPPPEGLNIGPPSSWTAAKVLSPDEALERYPATPGDSPALIPGTDRKLQPNATLDSRSRADLAATLWSRLEAALASDSLWENLRTPYPSPSPEASRVIVQQAIWRYMSVVDGDPYEKSHFREQMRVAAARKNATAAENKEVNAGVDDIWASVSLTGAEAKILRN